LSQKGHDCQTVQEAGWSGIQNGELLALAERKFDLLLTIDHNLKYQQNVFHRKIAILVLLARSNRVESLRRFFDDCASAMMTIGPGDVVVLGEIE
jgi:hypothetical protein